jgi:hypothetical protein
MAVGALTPLLHWTGTGWESCHAGLAEMTGRGEGRHARPSGGEDRQDVGAHNCQ